ncbi:hypothetical protein MKW92_014700 [Papaver armeniacum]|nr:hypothetical protein MKW92_014700 [Papaver armeniacum]
METKIRQCYSEPIDLNSKEFVEMMIIDGLFLIKMLIRSTFKSYDIADDPLDGNDWLRIMVKQDMFLLENQIPLFYSSLKSFIPSLFTKLKRTCITDNEEREKEDFFLPSATELSLAGVRFKKGSAQGSFLDIEFSRRTGILEIPPLSISDDTDPSLRNLIACEQSYGGTGYYITSYVNMMDFLINSADDVKLLRKKGIICNYLGCDEDVSDMFNKLCVGILDGGTYYSDCIRDINKFYKKRRHIWKATLKQEYFKSPWAIISVFAAVLLIALTIISTVFGILSFVIHKS